MPEDYERYAADMARVSADASLDTLRRQVRELNRRVDQIEARLASTGKEPVPTGTYYPS
jgi:hypothetical protein